MKSEIGVGTKVAFLIDVDQENELKRTKIESLFIKEFQDSPI